MTVNVRLSLNNNNNDVCPFIVQCNCLECAARCPYNTCTSTAFFNFQEARFNTWLEY